MVLLLVLGINDNLLFFEVFPNSKTNRPITNTRTIISIIHRNKAIVIMGIEIQIIFRFVSKLNNNRSEIGTIITKAEFHRSVHGSIHICIECFIAKKNKI